MRHSLFVAAEVPGNPDTPVPRPRHRLPPSGEAAPAGGAYSARRDPPHDAAPTRSAPANRKKPHTRSTPRQTQTPAKGPVIRPKNGISSGESRLFPKKSLSLPRRPALSLPATSRGRKVRATQSTTQANDLMAVRSWERNRKQPPVKASGWGRCAERHETVKPGISDR